MEEAFVLQWAEIKAYHDNTFYFHSLSTFEAVSVLP